VGPSNHVLDVGAPDPHVNGQFVGEERWPVVKYSDSSAVSCAKTAEPIEMPFWIWTLVGPYSTGSSCPIGCRTGHGRLAGSGGLDGDGSP